MADNKSTYSSLMNELVDVINEKANSSDSKNLEELVATAKTIVKPEGTLEITKNKQYDVSGYAFANVNVTSSGGDISVATSIVDKTIVEYNDENVTKIEQNIFLRCLNLTNVNTPNVTLIELNAFGYCSNLTNVNAPNLKTIKEQAFQNSGIVTIDFPSLNSVYEKAFQYCLKLESVSMPSMVNDMGGYTFMYCENLKNVYMPINEYLGTSTFNECKRLEKIDMPKLNNISAYAFNKCYSFKKLIIRQTTKVCTLANTNAFTSCYHILGTVNSIYNPNGDKDGYIYVPDSLVESYKSATNWSTYADQIKPLSELEE